MIRPVFFSTFLLLMIAAQGQELVYQNQDSLKPNSYYDAMPNYLTARFLIFEKYADFNINDNDLNSTIQYNSSPWPSVGIGAGYRWLGVSLSAGLKDPADTVYGKKHRIDFQTSFYLRRLTINIYSGIYSGYYLENPNTEIKNWPEGKYYTRSDIKTTTFGVNCFYVFNSEKYSNKATFVQNEWQKKSAGSFIAGGTILLNKVQADSSLIPANLNTEGFFKDADVTHYVHSYVGSEAGYTFTMVLKKRLFFNFSIMGGLGVGKTVMTPINSPELSEVKMNVTLHNSAGLGYNSQRFFAGFSYANIITSTPSPIEETSMGHVTGRFQLVAAYRFKIPEHRNPLPSWVPVKL